MFFCIWWKGMKVIIVQLLKCIVFFKIGFGDCVAVRRHTIAEGDMEN